MCRTNRVQEKLDPGASAKANAFLKEHAEEIKPEKSTSVSTIRVADCNINKGRSEDDRLGRHQRVTGAIEDEFLSAFGNLAELQDTDRLRDAVAGIMLGSVRDAASKYGLERDTVFRVRLMIELSGLDAGVQMLLTHIGNKRAEAAREARRAA